MHLLGCDLGLVSVMYDGGLEEPLPSALKDLWSIGLGKRYSQSSSVPAAIAGSEDMHVGHELDLRVCMWGHALL